MITRYEIPTGAQSGNITDLLLELPPDAPRCTSWQLQIVCTGAPSAGAVTLKSKLATGDRYFAVNDSNGNAVSLDITTSDSVTINDYVLGGLKITMASFATATSWYAILRGW